MERRDSLSPSPPLLRLCASVLVATLVAAGVELLAYFLSPGRTLEVLQPCLEYAAAAALLLHMLSLHGIASLPARRGQRSKAATSTSLYETDDSPCSF